MPEMIFGHLLTSSNYDDDQKKVTGGRNGYGAKLCNIFSTEFILETADKNTKKKYVQTWTNNMSKMGKARITANAKDEFTKITFKPDLAKFGMTQWDDDLEAIIKRRVYDMAGSVKDVKVFLNGERIKIKNFKQYVDMYLNAIQKENGTETKPTLVHDIVNDRWEVAFAPSGGAFQQVSFVNSIATTSGGTHVNNISDQLAAKLMEHIKSKNKAGAAIKPYQLKSQFFLFVNCLIENPAFTSQTKEQLTTKASAFGSKCTLSEEFIKKVKKSEVVSNILDFARAKADVELKKSDGGRRARISNVKLLDANKAGTRLASHCTLILTEGDSAKTLAVAGISALQDGRDLFGVFPLRGKLLNVRDATHEQIAKNVEIQAIKQILGLKHQQKYETTDGLRYGHLMIMTDQDHDGSHIKGLIINFFETQFPSLLKIPGFLIEFITPIVKVFKGLAKKPTQQYSFFTIPEYEHWKVNNPGKGWQHKYYKGLGTSNEQDAKIYFSDLDKHLKKFHVMDQEGKDLVELAFSKKKSDERKEWLRLFKPGTYLDHSMAEITYPDFVNKELILFSMADNLRSIPSVMDGLKPGQRKCLYAAFKKNLVKDSIKVAQLAGYVSEHTAYQHGEQSLQGTIVNLAQNFVGSNNVNYMEPDGGFGTRLSGGDDAASARYIYTALTPFARKLFPAQDDALLTYHMDDDDRIEPHYYIPILPTILLNGAQGIGTGWSSDIPNFNPEDIVKNLRAWMDGGEMGPMTPWYRGWTGRVEQVAPDKFKFHGTITKAKPDDPDDLVWDITELPIKVWTQEYKAFLEEIIKGEKYGVSWIKDYLEYHNIRNVHFQITFESRKAMEKAVADGLMEKFKLTKQVSTTNLVAFDAQGRITKYASVQDIMKEHAIIRLQYYQKRKDHLLGELNYNWRKLTNQARFIEMIIKKELVVSNKKRAVLIAELKKLGFEQFSKKKEAKAAGETEESLEEEGEEDAAVDGYNYLLGMAIWSLTKEKVEKLLTDVAKIEGEIETLTKLSPKDLWNTDLDAFLEEWHRVLEEDKRVADEGPVKKRAKKLTALKKGKKKDDDEDFDEDFAPKAKGKKGVVVKTKEVAVKKEDGTNLVYKMARAAAAKKKPIMEEDSDGDDAFDVLSESSVDKKPVVSKPPPKETAAPKANGAAKGRALAALESAVSASKPTPTTKPIIDDAFDISGDEMEDMAPAPPKPKASRAAASKKKNLIIDSDSEGEEADLDFGSRVKEVKMDEKKKAAAKPAATTTKKPTVVSKSLLDDDSGDAFEISSDSGFEVKRTILPLSPKKPKATAPMVVKKVAAASEKKAAKQTALLRERGMSLLDDSDEEMEDVEEGDSDMEEAVTTKPVAKKSASTVAKASAPAARPARGAAVRAATKKAPTYVLSDSEEEEEEEEDSEDVEVSEEYDEDDD